ncbi:hypothetical protein PGTUg99_036330 [Puccinia graminis f. sp. tritici]|uniref:Uncharacterized protein n=1 Tax=Puccinia graminis f. sp. tritici TaxID=56615 RepID=A0A5B0RY57_PUCGR|nr:hypothetical protein PGTUg99_036330 [Puccinia graminis f. sp. tritici]
MDRKRSSPPTEPTIFRPFYCVSNRPSVGLAPWSRGGATDDHEDQELGSTSHSGLELGPFGPLHTESISIAVPKSGPYPAFRDRRPKINSHRGPHRCPYFTDFILGPSPDPGSRDWIGTEDCALTAHLINKSLRASASVDKLYRASELGLVDD